jgi:hypothetical protein
MSTLEQTPMAERASNEILGATLALKIQVQEWKDLLLQGLDQSDYDKYCASFLIEADIVNTIGDLGDNADTDLKIQFPLARRCALFENQPPNF